MNEIRKSITSVLYERAVSPFYGTFIFSWVVWNWRIIYLTIFISEDMIDTNKIDYIVNNYSNINCLFWFPLISTFILVAIVPFVSNGVYWLSLKFSKWRYDSKMNIENKKALSVEKSIQLRRDMANQENQFDLLLTSKNEDIIALNRRIDDLVANNNEILNSTRRINEENFAIARNKIDSDEKMRKAFKLVYEKIIVSSGDLSRIDRALLSHEQITFFEAYDLISKSKDGYYTMNSEGKQLFKYLIEKEKDKS